MEETTTCPVCHVSVRPTDYFCYNCGKNLQPKPPSLEIMKLILLVLGSILLPPLGIFWAVPYLKQKELKYFGWGIMFVVLTLLSVVLTTRWVMDYVNKINLEVNQQLNQLQGF
jgi:hypothetical protein